MEDEKIIELFFARSELAIKELDGKYGKVCHSISYNILNNKLDAEECVNDAYLGTWNAIPPQRPNPLLAFVCKIVRRYSIMRHRANTAMKRNGAYDVAMEELEHCLADPVTVEGTIEAKTLARIIESFLDTLSEENRVIFMRRYWFSDSYADIAKHTGMTEKNVSVRLTRTRKQLREYLIERGVGMTASIFSDAMGEISEKYIMEAVFYQPKKKHIIWPRVRSAAACFLLAVLLTGSAILTFSVEARAAFFGWVREQYDNIYEYFFEGEATVTDPAKYELGWVPENCVFVTSYETAGGEVYIYTDERDTLIQFSYTSDPDNENLYITHNGAEEIEVTVNDHPAEIFISPSEENTDGIVWTDLDTNTLFFISGHFDEDTLIRMAESVKETE